MPRPGDAARRDIFRLMRRLPAALLLSVSLALGACQSSAGKEAAPQDYTWVWLLTGPHDQDVQGDARNAAFQGHFANMRRLSEDGTLALAGPLGPPLARPDHRGVFILATGDLAAARAATQTDPTVRAGIFVMELQPFRTATELSRIPAMHQAAVAASGVANPELGFHARPYVLVTGTPAADAESAMRARAAGPAVLFQGRLGSGADEQALFCLDLRDPAQAAAQLPDTVRWTVIPWFASEEVAVLGQESAR